MTTYEPRPIDTSDVKLSPDLQELVERLSENNHDNWAQSRIKEGWRYGPIRNDAEKLHPDLVPYNKLSEGEKGYDRRSVIESLKAIIALGYEISRR